MWHFIRASSVLLFFSALSVQTSSAYDNTEITLAKRKMIAESISSYSGNCACPYNSAVNGSSCGKRSAYSKPGGAAPLCYETEITDAQAIEWFKRKH